MNRILKIFFALMIIFIVSCNKNKDNYFCTITNPQEGQEFYEDEDIHVYVETTDDSGNTILLYLDDKCYTGSSDFPYSFTIHSGDLFPGKRTLRAVAQNNEGKQSRASVSISVKSAESPDSVSFSDGKLPIGWKTTGWHIDQSDGVSDMFSLYTRSDNATVVAVKTCSYIDFYLKGLGIVSLYLDNVLVEKIVIGNFFPLLILLPKWML